MTCLRPAVACEPIIDVVEGKYLISNPCKIFEIDLYTCTKQDLDFSSSYELTIQRDDVFSGIIGWFDCTFSKLTNKFELSTSPHSKSTHWKQTTFYTEKDISVNRGDKISGSIAVRKSKSNFRELDVKVSYHIKGYYGETNSYQLYKIR